MTTPPAPPIPDDKDWTWVLERPCPECGFDAASLAATDVADLLRANTAEWESVLAGPAAEARRRPAAAVWSPLEYACHVRDVHRLFLERLELMLREEGPHFANWDQDETAIAARYHEADPATVAAELRSAGDELADRFAGVSGAQWDRTGHRSDGAVFTVETFAKYFVHDPIHHIDDVRRAG